MVPAVSSLTYNFSREGDVPPTLQGGGRVPRPMSHAPPPRRRFKSKETEFVATVYVKLPDFWTEDPDQWFLHAEAAFRNPQITQSKTKFDHIIQKLPQKIMISVRGLIMGSAASSETPYKDLKAKLVSSYTLSRWQKVSKLIHHPGLGD